MRGRKNEKYTIKYTSDTKKLLLCVRHLWQMEFLKQCLRYVFVMIFTKITRPRVKPFSHIQCGFSARYYILYSRNAYTYIYIYTHAVNVIALREKKIIER